MESIKKLLIVLLVLALTLVGCDGRKVPDNKSPDSEAPPTTDGSISDTSTDISPQDTLTPDLVDDTSSLRLTEGGSSRYTVIRPEIEASGELDAAQAVQVGLSDIISSKQPINTDWVKRDADPDAVSEYEILIGNTNRTASRTVAERLASTPGWYVGRDGERVVIYATSGAYYIYAVEYFLSLVSESEGEKIMNITEHFEPISSRFDNVSLSLRVASYNIKHGADVGLDMSIIAKDITELGVDIVGIQEVDQLTNRVGGLNTMKALSEASGYQYYKFARGIDYQGGQYGTGILSRYPIESFEVITLTSWDKEARSIGHAVINIDGTLIDFFNTHLSFEDKNLRTIQFSEVADLLAKCDNYILTGDFNTSDMTEFTVLPFGTPANPNKLGTFTSSGKSIDNVIYSEVWKLGEMGLGPVGHSDHVMLWCDLSIGK